jgi:Ca-activated chloride channel family protein
LKLLDDERPRSVPGESETNVSDALVLGLHRLGAAGARRKVLVLLSDGEHNVTPTPSGLTPRQAAQIAANLGVRVYCIDAGGDASSVREPGARVETLANRAEGLRTLHEVAHITGGRSFSARDTSSLLAVWRDIDALERSDIVSFQYRKYYEGFTWFALAALAVWLIVGALELTFWQRVP